MVRYGQRWGYPLLVAWTASGLAACKPTDFSGNSQIATPNASGSGNNSGATSSAPLGAGVAPGSQPGATNAGGNGGIPTIGASTGGPSGGLTTAAGQTGASPSSGGSGIFSSILGALGAAGSVAGSVVQSATPQMPANMSPCSQAYYVPGTANPYLAGEPAGSTITYTVLSTDGPNPTDSTSLDAPVQVQPTGNCLVPGHSLYFFVYGLITYAQGVAPVDANGNRSEILQHQLGGYFGKSNAVAPLCALMGVFLGSNDPSNSTPPAGLDFSSQAARDYTSFTPQLGQVFFIGTGQTSSGAYHQIIVPQGATQLYFATWDTYQWNNNLGGVNAQVMVQQ